MSDLIPFHYHDKPVPVQLTAEGEPLWRAADVGKALTYKGDMGQHIRRLEDDERFLILNQGGQEEWWVNESGLYALILGSRKKEARDFKRWVTHDVLPQIRKTGKYDHAPALDRYPELRAIVELAASTAVARILAEEAKTEAVQAKTEAKEASANAHRALESQLFFTVAEYVYLA